MESELRCPVCRNIFKNPVLLPCNDSFCISCAASLLKEVSPAGLPPLAQLVLQRQRQLQQQQQTQLQQQHHHHRGSLSTVVSASLEQHVNNILETGSLASGSSNESAFEAYQEIPDLDKLSLISEADSGVVTNSRPNSYVGSSSSSAGSCPSTPGGPSLQQQQQQQHLNHLHLQQQPHPLLSAPTPTPSPPSSSAASTASSSSSSPSTTNDSNYLVAHPVNGAISCSIECPSCRKTTLLDENGVHSLPKNHALSHVIDRIFDHGGGVAGKKNGFAVFNNSGADLSGVPSSSSSSKSSTPPPPPPPPASTPPACQLCPEHSDAATAAVFCEQCEIFYCVSCRDRCHPSRGPLARHCLVSALAKITPPAAPEVSTSSSSTAPSSLAPTLDRKSSRKSGLSLKCADHVEENVSMYCVLCKTPVCYACLQEGRHFGHDVHAMGALCKQGKTELSHVLQSLSEKARIGTEHLQRLKTDCEKVHESSVEFEAAIVAQCDALINALQRRKTELLREIEIQKREKSQMLKDQVSENSTQLQHITGLLQYSIEVLKEPDPSAFLLVSSGLIQRVVATDRKFERHLEASPKISADFEYAIEKRAAAEAIENVRLVHLRVPGAPLILPEECSSENNSVTIAWAPCPGTNPPQFYVLELDDGTGNGNFRQVYCGPESVCSVDGLHFNSIYSARVKACNHAGEGAYSQLVRLQTAEVAWFSFEPTTAHPDITFSNESSTVSCSSFDDRVALGNVGFTRGVHYWEVRVDRYDNHPDPAFGIARFDVTKDTMLGKDDKGWSMYIDSSRSWFMNASSHTNRSEGGVRPGSVVGVLLNLDEKTLSFFVNDVMQGPPRVFDQLDGVFYPAVSLNRNVTLTLTSGLEPPTIVEERMPL